MRESTLENRLRVGVLRKGGLTYKFVSPSNRSVPDRLIIYRGRVVFVEMKRPGQKPTKLQAHTQQLMRAAGAEVLTLDTVERVDWFLGTLK